MQAELNSLYRGAWETLYANLPAGKGISNPLLINVPEAYASARLKLLIVGQETNGWQGFFKKTRDDGFVTTVESLLEAYRSYDLGRKDMRKPFFRATHHLQSLLAPAVPSYGFVWTNLFICDQHQTTPKDAIAGILRKYSVLQQEIDILEPGAVVFFSGPDYDYTIKHLFSGVEFLPVQGETERVLSRLVHPGLPANCYRTYHPSYLMRDKRMDVVDKIAARLAA